MSSQLLRALTTWAGRLTPGLERKTTFVDGELELELTLRVRRHSPHETIVNYRAAALEQLGGERHYLVRHCGCHVKRRGMGWARPGDCRGRVVAAVVHRGYDGQPLYLFVCGRHREHHGLEAKSVLAAVELPERQLAELRKRDEAKAAEWSAKCRADDEARERAEKGAVAP